MAQYDITTIEELLEFLKIPKQYIKENSGVVYETDNGKAYQMDILNSDAYSKLYLYITSIIVPLDGELDYFSEQADFNTENSTATFTGGPFKIILYADFNEESYTITFTYNDEYGEDDYEDSDYEEDEYEEEEEED